MNAKEREALRVAIDAKRREQAAIDADGIQHGTEGGAMKCRRRAQGVCDDCRTASREARKERHARRTEEERRAAWREQQRRYRASRKASA